MTPEQEHWMQCCIALARQAAAAGETPVGAVVVRHGVLVAEGKNQREHGKSALLHAEMVAIHRACEVLGGWRLWDCELYVTLEPCPMCAGAIINARLSKLCFGADDPKAGCCGSVTNLFALPFNHRPVITAGLLAEECAAPLRDFFLALRKKKLDKPVDLCYTKKE